VAIGHIADFVTESANSQNRRGVQRVEVAVPASVLASGLVIVDTPGVGSVHGHNTHMARQARAEQLRAEHDAARQDEQRGRVDAAVARIRELKP
jgi:hypothetical protein